MERAIGPDHISEDAASYCIDGVCPRVVAFPGDVQELSQAMAAAWGENRAVAPWGGGTRISLGNAIRRLDTVLNLSRLNRVIQHTPADLTATVEAGVAVASLQRALAEHGQFLAIDPPLPDRATIGGTLAVGVSGPLKWHYGLPRDLVIGMKVVQADGKVTKSGGQVVKNVSGYDMARLHVGGLGTLGVIAEVSFKLTPLPRKEATLVAGFEASGQCLGAGLALFHSPVVPLALSHLDAAARRRAKAVNVDANHCLAIRLGGRPLTLERQIKECEELCRQHGARVFERLGEADWRTLWRRVADFGWDEETAPVLGARASVLPAQVASVVERLGQSDSMDGLHQAIATHPGYGTVLVNWFGDGDVSDDAAEHALRRSREAVHGVGGRMVIERCPTGVKSRLDVWDDVGEPLAIMRRLKEQYDPKGVLNPGRFAGGI